MELNLAVVASRSSLVGALLRTASPSSRPTVFKFLRGLSRDELACVAEFEGACTIEAQFPAGLNRYRLLPEFFDPEMSDRWNNAEDRAHKTFVVLAWMEYVHSGVPMRVHSASVHA